MAKVEKNSHGSFVTLDGLRAVLMTRSSGVLPDGFAYFDFRVRPLDAVTRIEWPAKVAGADSALAIVPAAVANILLAGRYARDPSDDEVGAWNAAHDDAAGSGSTESASPAIPPATTADPKKGGKRK